MVAPGCRETIRVDAAVVLGPHTEHHRPVDGRHRIAKERKLLMEQAVILFEQHPVTGIGAGQFPDYCPPGQIGRRVTKRDIVRNRACAYAKTLAAEEALAA